MNPFIKNKTKEVNIYKYIFLIDNLLTEVISLSNTNTISYNKKIVDKLLIIIKLK